MGTRSTGIGAVNFLSTGNAIDLLTNQVPYDVEHTWHIQYGNCTRFITFAWLWYRSVFASNLRTQIEKWSKHTKIHKLIRRPTMPKDCQKRNRKAQSRVHSERSPHYAKAIRQIKNIPIQCQKARLDWIFQAPIHDKHRRTISFQHYRIDGRWHFAAKTHFVVHSLECEGNGALPSYHETKQEQECDHVEYII